MSAFEVKIVPSGTPIDLRHLGDLFLGQLIPTELFIKEDGAKDDTPSHCFVLKTERGQSFAAQISDNMLREGLARAGALRGIASPRVFMIESKEHQLSRARCWWRAGANGYTEDMGQAGLYTYEQADEITQGLTSENETRWVALDVSQGRAGEIKTVVSEGSVLTMVIDKEWRGRRVRQ